MAGWQGVEGRGAGGLGNCVQQQLLRPQTQPHRIKALILVYVGVCGRGLRDSPGPLQIWPLEEPIVREASPFPSALTDLCLREAQG